jgi:hypothetical protein
MKMIFSVLSLTKITILLMGAVWAGEVHAQGLFDFYSRAKFGLNFEILPVERQVLNGDQGFMAGIRYSRYLGKSLSIGIGADAGQPTVGYLSKTNLQKFGLVLGYDEPLVGPLYYDVSVMSGYGYGESEYLGKSGAGYFVQGTGGLGLRIFKGFRLFLQAGYFHMPSFEATNGWLVGGKIEYKIDLYEDSTGVND